MARKRSPSDTIDGQHQQRPGNGHGDEGWTTVPAGGSTNGRKKHKKNSSAQSARSHRDEIDRAVRWNISLGYSCTDGRPAHR